MTTDWLGIGISTLIILFIILIVIAKVQGDRVIDVLKQIFGVFRGTE